ncbi:hypothetical protein A2U01_0116508, partial [Trifolium medium]|nr:hypothetical protein [Trifolium medium]
GLQWQHSRSRPVGVKKRVSPPINAEDTAPDPNTIHRTNILEYCDGLDPTSTKEA